MMAPRSDSKPSGTILPSRSPATQRPPSSSMLASPDPNTPKCGPLGPASGSGAQISPGGNTIRLVCKATALAQRFSAGMPIGRDAKGRPNWTCSRRSRAKHCRASFATRNFGRESNSRVISTSLHPLLATAVAVLTSSSPIKATSPREAPGPATPTAPISLECNSILPSSSTIKDVAGLPSSKIACPGAICTSSSSAAMKVAKTPGARAKERSCFSTGSTFSFRQKDFPVLGTPAVASRADAVTSA
mmetsp:Transcript_18100/g.31733  ORF Transcript_18100/g.31733 Transcript_18100/m.31733 type:complete len:246 (+) Transcript_18100:645-1382(+)